MSNEDFTNLWKNKQSDGKPKASVIGGLQKLVEEKDAEILQLKEENVKLKEHMNEDVEILTQSEQTIKNKKKKIDDYALKLEEVQTQMVTSGKGGDIKLDIFKSSTSSGSKSASESQEVQKLRGQLRSLEDKLYVFSTLPDRIATLEEQKAKDVALIEDLETKEKELRKKLKDVGDKDSAVGVIDKLEAKVQQLTKENKQQAHKIEELENDSMAPKSKTHQEPTESADSPWKTRYEKAREQYEKLLASNQKLNEDLDSAKNSISHMKESIKATPSSDDELDDLKSNLNDVKKQLSNAKATISEMTTEQDDLKGRISSLQRQSTPSDTQEKLDQITSENENLKKKLKEADKKFEDLLFKFQQKEQSTEKVIVEKVVDNRGLVDEIQSKLDKERAKTTDLSNQIKTLNEKLAKSESSAKSPPPPKLPPVEAPQTSQAAVGGLVDEMQQKLEKQKKIIKKLTDDNEALSSLKSKQDEFGKITSENAELKKKVEELSKKLEQKPEEVPILKEIPEPKESGDTSKLQAELNELKQENMQMKEKLNVATASNQNDVMALVQDLQSKLNKLKKENLKLKKDLGQPV